MKNPTWLKFSAQASILLAVFGSRRESCGLETEPKGPNVSSGPGLGTLESQAFRSRAIAPYKQKLSACPAWTWSPLLA